MNNLTYGLRRFEVIYPPRRCRPSHGPQKWPWWRLVSFAWVKLPVKFWESGRSLWVYTRWGAWWVDFYYSGGCRA